MIPSDFTFVPTEPDIDNITLVKVYEEAYQNGADDMLEQFIDYLESKGIAFEESVQEIVITTGYKKRYLIEEDRFNTLRKDCYNEGYSAAVKIAEKLNNFTQ